MALRKWGQPDAGTMPSRKVADWDDGVSDSSVAVDAVTVPGPIESAMRR